MATPGPAIGDVVGSYRVLSQLGHGGMGIVYLAEDTRLGRKVALKALARDYAGDPTRRKRFLNEARAAAALSHPAVAAVYELEERGDDIFIIFEYVEGQNLRAKVGTTALPQLLEIAVQIAAAMEAAHAKGIVHRDLKPENVMVTPGGDVKVLDFGLARFDSGVLGGQSETQSFGLTQAGTVMGTVGYMSPEQLEGKPTDFRSDLFSFGAMLYELATGTHPFAGDTPASTIANVMTQEPPPLTSANSLHPPELERIVRKCLRKSRDDRYQSTRDLLVDLKQLKRDSDERPTVTMSASRTATAAPAPAMLPALAVKLLRTRIIVGLVMAPANIAFAWVMKDWMMQPLGTGLFFIIVMCMAAAIGVRVLLGIFMSWRAEELPHVVALSAPWAALANLATATALLVMAAQTYQHHIGFAAFVTFAALGGIFVTVVIEPMMLRRAFPSIDPKQFLQPAADINCANVQILYGFLLASPLVDLALSPKTPADYVAPLAPWPAVARWLIAAAAVVAYAGGIAALIWAGENVRGGPSPARTLRRWFPAFFAVDLATMSVWTAWLALVHPPPRPIYFLLLFLVWLPFYQLKLARAVPGSDIVEAASPDREQRSKAHVLGVIQACFALVYAGMGIMLSKVWVDIVGKDIGMPHQTAAMAGTTVLVMGGFFVSGASTVGFFTRPQEAARQFARMFPVFALVNIFGAIYAGAMTVPLLNSFLLLFLIPIAAVSGTFYQRRLARELAPPTGEGAPERRRFLLGAIQAVYALPLLALAFRVADEFLGNAGVLNMFPWAYSVVMPVLGCATVLLAMFAVRLAYHVATADADAVPALLRHFWWLYTFDLLAVLSGLAIAVFYDQVEAGVVAILVLTCLPFYQRFLLERLASEPAGESAAADLAFRRARLFVAVVLLVALAAGSARLFYQPPKAHPAFDWQALKGRPITQDGKVLTANMGVSLSPDGRFLAYEKHDAGKYSVWVRQLSQPSEIELIPGGDTIYAGLMFTPDGDSLYLLRYDPKAKSAGGDLVSIPTLGGAQQPLLRGLTTATGFSPDGKRIAFGRGERGQEMTLNIANADGTGEKVVERLPAGSALGPAVSWSPDGRWLATILVHPNGTSAVLHLVAVDDGRVQDLRGGLHTVGEVAWLPDGSGLLVVDVSSEAAGQQPRPQLLLVRYPAGEVTNITRDFVKLHPCCLSVSRDGKVAVAQVASGDTSRADALLLEK